MEERYPKGEEIEDAAFATGSLGTNCNSSELKEVTHGTFDVKGTRKRSGRMTYVSRLTKAPRSSFGYLSTPHCNMTLSNSAANVADFPGQNLFVIPRYLPAKQPSNPSTYKYPATVIPQFQSFKKTTRKPAPLRSNEDLPDTRAIDKLRRPT